jgi:exonuclease 3'-5' domain-containing protein 1
MAETYPSSTFIGDNESMQDFLDSLDRIGRIPIFISLESVSLERHRINIMTVSIPAHNHIYLIDVHTLQHDAFNIPSSNGATFRHVLQSSWTPKVLYDLRKASAILFHTYGIRMKCVTDIQLLELASRPSDVPTMLLTLESALRAYGAWTHVEHMLWDEVRYDAWMRCGNSEHGPAFQVLLERPLHPDIKAFCMHEVLYLPRLRLLFLRMLGEEWVDAVKTASARRVTESTMYPLTSDSDEDEDPF